MTTAVTPVTIELRPYQDEALERTAAAEARGIRRQLGVAATGLGKTVMFVALARARNARTLILVHRDELARQAYEKVRQLWPECDVGIVKAAEDDVSSHVVVASVQTLSRQRRLDRLIASQTPGTLSLTRELRPFELVIVDEAHHTAADSYKRILEQLRAGEKGGERAATPEEVDAGCELGIAFDEPGPLLLGVTATPDRGDGKGLDDLFDEIVWNYDILWGIRSGYLADVRGRRVELTDLDLENVKVTRGDFEAGAVGKAMEDAHAPEFVVKAWKAHASDRRTLVFMPTVALADETAKTFRANGVAAGFISAAVDLSERRRTLAAYSSGELQVLVNCMVLTEGYDEPRTDCIIQARPTKNRALFTQMIGRGTRKHPDKTDLLVLDIVGSSRELSLVTLPSLLGADKRFAQKLQDGTGTLTDVAQQWDDHKVSSGKMRAEDADLFRAMHDSGEIAWVHVESRLYQRTLADRDQATGQHVQLPTVVLKQQVEGDEGWLCGLIMPDGKKRVLIRDVTLEMAQGVGEDAVRKLTKGRTALVDKNAEWRKKRPSNKARRAAQKWRLPRIEQYKTAGELSDALDAHIQRTKQKRGKK